MSKKMSIAWTDFAAGLATAELGPISFVIGGAASMAKWNDFFTIYPVPDPVPSSTNDQGVLHNVLCSNYLAPRFPKVNYDDVINLACQVRPDLAHEIQAITEEYYNAKVLSALTEDLSTPKRQISFITSIIKLDDNDTTSVTNVLNNLSKSEDPNIWEANVNGLIGMVPSFNLSQADQTMFMNSLSILRSSYVLWSDF